MNFPVSILLAMCIRTIGGINTIDSLNDAWLGNLKGAMVESSGPLNNTFQSGRSVMAQFSADSPSHVF